MPGVPSSRACKACRAQKKLNIECIGAGQKRFKFVAQWSNQEEESTSTSKQVAKKRDTAPSITLLLPSPANETTSFTSAWIDSIQVEKLGYRFGMLGPQIMLEIPKRLGHSDALDKAAHAVVSAFTYIRTGQQQREAYIKYGYALKALRLALQDPKQGATSHTLCTIWMLMLCQNWIGRPEIKYGTHVAGMFHVMNTFAETINWHDYDEFDAQLIIASCYTMIMEQLSNPGVTIGPWLSKFGGPQGPRIYIPEEIQTIRIKKMEQINKSLLSPVPDRIGIERAYHDVHSDISILRRQIAEYCGNITPDTPFETLPPRVVQIFFGLKIRYSLVLPYAIMIIYMFIALTPNEAEFKTLPEELAFCVEELLDLAKALTPFRPLGTESLPPSLSVAWATTDDVAKKAETQKWIVEYDSDFVGGNTMPVAIWCKKWITGRREKWLAHYAGEVQDTEDCEVTDAELEATLGPGRKCCIL
ncbi:hypothetical protein DM02DRAFT_729313 [Periconia macrospinosa]|uniref:Zn(2)-C6 fungal-type domain-containing protein n=1 Tax=Periconia macrospinosa TaxID=97972 RepID=A0A2V1DM91_9PLEO|nr:hypothetical protein DM02DRAFT_729313 [Periconia macrospinosa]